MKKIKAQELADFLGVFITRDDDGRTVRWHETEPTPSFCKYSYWGSWDLASGMHFGGDKFEACLVEWPNSCKEMLDFIARPNTDDFKEHLSIDVLWDCVQESARNRDLHDVLHYAERVRSANNALRSDSSGGADGCMGDSP